MQNQRIEPGRSVVRFTQGKRRNAIALRKGGSQVTGTTLGPYLPLK